jgi:hypothetical protein
MTMSETGTRTYEIVTAREGKFRIDIPEAWKVTFGPIIGAKGYDGGGMAFRVWESEKQQRALFTNVTGFRDLSLPMMREAVRKYGTDDWVMDDGSYVGKKSETVERKWVPADEVKAPTPAEDGPMEFNDDENVVWKPMTRRRP